jgi:hypothetical protein
MGAAESSSPQGEQQTSLASDVGGMAIQALPWIAIGALAGGVAKVVTNLAEVGEDKKRERHAMFAPFKYVANDRTLCASLENLEMFTTIHPRWLPAVLDHLNFINHAWFRFRDMEKEAMALFPGGIVDPQAYNSHLMKDAVSFLEKLLSFELFAPTAPVNHSPQDTEKKLNEFNAANAQLDALIAETNHLLSAVLASRVTLSGQMSELQSVVSLFNGYWLQSEQTIMFDGARHLQAYAQEKNEAKLSLIKAYLKSGKLMVPIPGIVENKLTMSCIKWWATMHTSFLPSMYYVANALGLNTTYNPKVDANKQEGASTNRRGGVVGSSAKTSPAGNHIPGQSFVQTPGNALNQVQLEKDPTKHAELTAFQKTAQSIDIARPSTDLSLHRQAVFLANRVIGERGIADVVKHPWAGYTPTVGEPGFIPTVKLSKPALKDYMMSILTQVDTQTQGMFQMQHKLMYLMLQLKHHWPAHIFAQSASAAEAHRAMELNTQWNKMAQ